MAKEHDHCGPLHWTAAYAPAATLLLFFVWLPEIVTITSSCFQPAIYLPEFLKNNLIEHIWEHEPLNFHQHLKILT